MKFYELISVFQNTRNAKQSFEAYEEYMDECTSHKLDVISCDEDMVINIPILKDIMAIPQIKTIFKYPNLSFLNTHIVNGMKNNARVQVKHDYSISFDANAARYVHDYMHGYNVPKEFIPILHFLLDNNLNLDPVFYILENIAKGNETIEFYNNMISIKKLMTCDMKYYKATNKIKSIYSDEDVKLRLDNDLAYLKSEQKNNEIITVAQNSHMIMKIILMAITIARFKYKNNLKLQLKYIVKFMDEKLQTMYLRELTIALQFFEKKNMDFFEKLNNKSSIENTLEIFDNMAWDFAIVRMLEMYFTSKPNPEADFFIPLLYTHDKALLEVMDLFVCKDFLMFHNEKRTVPIPYTSIMPKLKKYNLDNFFTEEALLNRINSNKKDYGIILDELTIEIKRIFKL